MRKLDWKSFLILILFSINLGKVTGQVYPIPNGWIDKDGVITEFIADTTFFSDGDYARYEKEGKFKFAKLKDLSFVSKSYQALTDFREGVALAKQDGVWWVIDTLEKKIKEVSCHYAYSFKEGLARIQLGNRFGYINKDGDVVIPIKYSGAYSFVDGRARVYIKGKWGIINKQGQYIVKPSYDFIRDFSDGLACVMKQQGQREKWGFVNKDGVEVITLKYDYALSFSEGIALVRMGDLFQNDLRFIDKNDHEINKIPFDDVFPFSNGLACFFDEGKWGYLNKALEVVIPPNYEHPISFNYGLAYVSINGKSKYINTKGETVWE